VEHWLTRWEKAYTDGRALDIPDITGKRLYRDFLAAIHTTASGFSNYWQNRLIAQETIPNFYGLIQQYCEFQALVPN
jgi:hypothetical protein